MATKLFRLLLGVDGLYSLVTAVWPLIHIDSFMQVTGSKTDIWLVKTVSLLILAIAVFFLSSLQYSAPNLPVCLLGIFMSGGLAFVDFYYAAIDRIRNIYMADGIVQLFLFAGWSYLIFLIKSNSGNKKV